MSHKVCHLFFVIFIYSGHCIEALFVYFRCVLFDAFCINIYANVKCLIDRQECQVLAAPFPLKKCMSLC